MSTPYYTNFAFVVSRFSLDILYDLLADLIPDGTEEEDREAIIEAWVEAEIVKIDSLINASCAKQVDIPVSTDNPSFGMLRDIAESYIIRKVASHTQHDDLPSKIENDFAVAALTLRQIQRGEIVLTQDDQTGPNPEGDSVTVSDAETSPFHIDMEDAW